MLIQPGLAQASLDITLFTKLNNVVNIHLAKIPKRDV